MRKSKIAKFLALATLLLATFSFIACGGNGAGGGDDAGDGSGSGSGSGAGSGILSEEEAYAKLKAIGDYEIIAEMNDGHDKESFTLGKKGTAYWMIYEGHGNAYVIDGENAYVYSGGPDENEDFAWSFVMPMPSDGEGLEQNIENLQMSIASWLYYANNIGEPLTTVGSATVAGRACTHYRYTHTASAGGMSGTATEDVYVDNETGITLKYVIGYTITGGGQDDSDSTTYEVKSFKTGNAVTLPDFPEPDPELEL